MSDSSAIQGELDQLTEQINTIAGEVLGDSNFVSGLDANDPAATQAALETAFETINQTATDLGAESNALDSQVSTYETTRVNLSESRSRIRDTDVAATSAEAQQTNVLLQSAIIAKKDEDSRKGLLVNQIV
ncbi:flagellin [Thalassotalea fusca]